MTVFHLGSHDNPDQLWEDFLNFPPDRVAIDTETPSLSDRSLLGIGVAISPFDAFYVSVEESDFPRLIHILRNRDVTKIYHNAPYDLRVLRPYGIDIWNTEDTCVMARLSPLVMSGSLEEASVLVDEPTDKAGEVMVEYNVKTMDKLPPDVLAKKCATDAKATYRLMDFFKGKYKESVYEVDRKIIPILESISSVGIQLDQERRGELEEFYTKEINYYRAIALGQFGFNPGSSYEVGFTLAKRGNYLPLTKSRTRLATDEKTLKKVNDPLARLVLLYRHAQKMLGTYLVPYRGLDRAYTTLHLDAATSRISSTNAGKSNPDRNLQNIPKNAERKNARPVRSMFVPDVGDSVLTQADESQVEIRVLAHLSGDERMLSVFQSGGSIHRDTHKALSDRGVHVSYIDAKTFNFGGPMYGGTARTVADNLGTNDVALMEKLIGIWNETYPQAASWIARQRQAGLKEGSVEGFFGRKMKLPMEMNENHAGNCAVNYPIQNSAADLFKRVMLECVDLLGPTRLPIHDAYLFSGDYSKAKDWEELANLTPIYAPLEVEVMPHWG